METNEALGILEDCLIEPSKNLYHANIKKRYVIRVQYDKYNRIWAYGVNFEDALIDAAKQYASKD